MVEDKGRLLSLREESRGIKKTFFGSPDLSVMRSSSQAEENGLGKKPKFVQSTIVEGGIRNAENRPKNER